MVELYRAATIGYDRRRAAGAGGHRDRTGRDEREGVREREGAPGPESLQGLLDSKRVWGLISTILMQNVELTLIFASGLLATTVPDLHSDKVAGASVPGILSVNMEPQEGAA